MRTGVVLLALLVVAAVATRVWVFRHNRRMRDFYRAHPEERPYGRQALLRIGPWLGLGAVFTVFGLVMGDSPYIVYGGLSVLGFSYLLWKAWPPPT